MSQSIVSSLHKAFKYVRQNLSVPLIISFQAKYSSTPVTHCSIQLYPCPSVIPFFHYGLDLVTCF